jgi:DNA primase
LQPLTDSQLESLEEATFKYEAALTVEAARYLLDRGLTQETVRTHRLGVVADPLPGHEPFRGMLAIPYLFRGQPTGIRFRCLEEHDHGSFSHGKYMQPSGSRVGVYGVDAIHEARNVLHITEGEFDRMILVQSGLPAIGFPGASTFRGYHGRMLAGFNRIWVWGDPDQAGAEFIQKVTNRLPRSAKGVKLRAGDVTDTYLAGGVKTLYSLVEGEEA